MKYAEIKEARTSRKLSNEERFNNRSRFNCWVSSDRKALERIERVRESLDYIKSLFIRDLNVLTGENEDGETTFKSHEDANFARVWLYTKQAEFATIERQLDGRPIH